MRLVLDAGALIGLDRNDRHVVGLIALARRGEAELVTVAPIVAQVWRDGARQAHLARALPMINVFDVDLEMARWAGELLRGTGGADVVDALVTLLVRPGDQILTSDPGDIGKLLVTRAVRATVVAV